MHHYKYWAKAERSGSAYHLLPYHLLDVAAVGDVLTRHENTLPSELHARAGLDPDTARAFVCFLLSLHDFGKFSHTFQYLRPDIDTSLNGISRPRPMAYGMHHGAMGKLLWEECLTRRMMSNLVADRAHSLRINSIRRVLNPWMETVMGHHGAPIISTQGLLRDKFDERDIAAAEQLFDDLLRLHLRDGTGLTDIFEKIGSMENGDTNRLSWLMAGLTILSDWVGSNAELFPFHPETIPIEHYWREYALPQAEEALQTLMLLPTRVRSGVDFHALFNAAICDPTVKMIPTPLQRYALECDIPDGPNLYIMEDLTGAGKTEAALSLAYRMMENGQAEGWYFALPTQATSNGIFARTASMYENCYDERTRPTIVLAHGGKAFHAPFQAVLATTMHDTLDSAAIGILEDEEFPGGASCSAWLAEDSRRAFLASVGVGTIDQALLSVLPVRYQALRLYGLSRKVLIVDEVHAYDSYMRNLLGALLSFHSALGGSTILLSATLPSEMRSYLIHAFLHHLGDTPPHDLRSEYPLVTHVSWQHARPAETPISCRTGGKREVQFHFSDSKSAVHERIGNAVDRGQCVCWIRNTVNDAIDAYRELIVTYGRERIDLFHARFTQHDRSNIERRVMTMFGKESGPESRAGRILVATQVVEQSLDLDFDVLISDLAPVDLIIQRAGRLHRHSRGERGKPEMLVFGPVPVDDAGEDWYPSLFPRAAWVYQDHGRLWLTARVLRERDGVQCFPEHARTLIESVHGPHAADNMPAALRAPHFQAEGKVRGQGSLATARVLNVMDGYTAQNTRWENDQIASTRLGQGSVRVVLLKRIENTIEPWHGFSEGGIMLSGLNCPANLFKAVPELRRDSVLKDFLETYRAVFKWARPLVLAEDNAVWCGQSSSTQNAEILWCYDSAFGLQKQKVL
ncbi:MAG: CRISPR-associated helicase Cas3' [Ignavibacteriae bacterium]|nr:CRISPR-associated helicase Cas3' [Ignavibacteriota bacterium]